jgi:hypothetical protein
MQRNPTVRGTFNRRQDSRNEPAPNKESNKGGRCGDANRNKMQRRWIAGTDEKRSWHPSTEKQHPASAE